MQKTSRQLCSIPNLLSMLRIFILPFFVWAYLWAEPKTGYPLSCILLVLSGLSDLLDGFIARRFDMVTDVGKILDPVADKLTQITILLCLTLRYPSFLPLLLVFALKELLMLTGGLLLLHRHIHPGSAKWFGKIATCFFYLSMVLVVLFPALPFQTMAGIAAANLLLCIFALLMYIPIFFNLKKESGKR
ncbi:MAG: CDP-alcohol phosphatidyltransferase family protein [Provencibacterium sp.]|jgi:cardiolipin synthase|nr:CDP-alcohol phosphatidyltransferase family protein [Provencibacterium sp.]